jgi:hypothetical protein
MIPQISDHVGGIAGLSEKSLTMGLGLATTDAHIDYISRVRDRAASSGGSDITQNQNGVSQKPGQKPKLPGERDNHLGRMTWIFN